MDLLDKLIEQAQKSTVRGFAEQFVGVYLLGKIPDVAALGFATRVGAPNNQDLLNAIRAGNKAKTNGTFLMRVEKSDRNTWKSRISVGRAKNNDLVFRHDSVSKLHAHFFVHATVRRGHPTEELMLSDVGSANGTLVNGRTVDEGEEHAVAVKAGDRIHFGEVECDLLDAGSLHPKLKRLAARSDF